MQASNWRVLALTVISEAITDMQEAQPSVRQPAIDWLLHDDVDFPRICDMAGIDAASVRKSVLSRLPVSPALPSSSSPSSCVPLLPPSKTALVWRRGFDVAVFIDGQRELVAVLCDHLD